MSRSLSRARVGAVWYVVVVVVVVVVAILGGCATGPHKETAPAAASEAAGGMRAREYWPLAVGNRWTYRTQAPGQAPSGPEEEQRIVDRDARGYFVDNHGIRLAPRSDGIFDGSRFLLQEPLEEGHAWMAVVSTKEVERYRISGVGLIVSVPAGTFEDCIEVESRADVQKPTGERATLVMSWTFARGVGMIRATQKVQPDGQGELLPVSSRVLVSYQVLPPA